MNYVVMTLCKTLHSLDTRILALCRVLSRSDQTVSQSSQCGHNHILTILAARHVIPALPYLLSFAAGAMFYVVVEELIPEMSQGTHTNVGTIFFAIGFSLMMVLDVALG